ncbi:MAG: hypothetical protein ABSC34_12150 [Acidimicrobiales bacterium]|jgi:hypothetical protein
MRRKTLDLLLVWLGGLLTVMLLVAGAGLVYGSNFTSSSVKTQLAQQKVYFDSTAALNAQGPAVSKYLDQYAGQQLLTGVQAQAYANHFIQVHLNDIDHGKTYAQASTACDLAPTVTCNAQDQLLFEGSTTRGLLLNAYAFGTIATIALFAGFASFVLALLMLVLTLLGLRHYRRADPSDVI